VLLPSPSTKTLEFLK